MSITKPRTITFVGGPFDGLIETTTQIPYITVKVLKGQRHIYWLVSSDQHSTIYHYSGVERRP